MKKLLQLMLVALLAFGSLQSVAATDTQSDPYGLIKSVGDQLFVDISKLNTLEEAHKKAELKKLVREQLMPHIDIKYVSFKLLGKHVREIKREQAVTFIDAVEQYLANTYANALMSYKGQQVNFIEPVVSADSKFASVKSEIVEPNAPTIDIVFKFRKNKAGEWQVYDLVAESISLLSAKQKEITSRISEVGIDQVSKELVAKS
ncbi:MULTISPECIES: ABC transporter substrate-binding protein [Pseudoalteromonas]|uniref:ABC transporter substrate-binding protein n=1 Tax=Pseudoalteromonas rubra TaxID=43658 RepID=A0A5S3URT6_9GAMM|nr:MULTISPECIES: ABC transporter substrate-binding protein [Pseudoalteromonas]MCG7562476.1 ABC transporter substrate-binding protein [Pseudoalteromonas sp. McH1-42]MEC4087158.1 ABC transporter substrate-binding protein [Pseudoalteromonas rubra]QPB83662.1 ABC transporter substrate-binding protein [Pseudoalteromonas rubra]